jgi:hypothetical protein
MEVFPLEIPSRAFLVISNLSSDNIFCRKLLFVISTGVGYGLSELTGMKTVYCSIISTDRPDSTKFIKMLTK